MSGVQLYQTSGGRSGCVQSAVCKALEAHKSIKNTDAIKTWFYRILINECLIIIKKRRKETFTADMMEREVMYFEKGYEQGDDIEKVLDMLEKAFFDKENNLRK